MSIEKYREFVNSKQYADVESGFDIDADELNDHLKPFQRAVVRWALARGRAAIFEDTGLGKTIQLLEWANQVCNHTGGRVLILSPLCVAPQTVAEASKFGIDGVEYSRDGSTLANADEDAIAWVGEVVDAEIDVMNESSKWHDQTPEGGE